MSVETETPHRRWLWAAGVLLVVVALIAVGIAFFGNGDGEPTPIDSASATSTPSASAPVPDVDPTGCLGGPDRDAAMLLASQQAAQHSKEGATELATSFVRWLQRFPYPSLDEATEVSDRILAASSFADDLAGYIADEPDLSGGIVATGENYFMSSVPGVWHVESASADEVEVTIGTAFVVNGSLSPTLRSSITITTEWEDGVWRISQADGTRTTQDLFAIGQPFTGGC